MKKKIKNIIKGMLSGALFAWLISKTNAPEWAVVMTFLMVADAEFYYSELKDLLTPNKNETRNEF
jgi:hypothetical protein